jgi:drug/metabolite transporter (DMT)-like permease
VAEATLPEEKAHEHDAGDAFAPLDWGLFLALSGIWGASFLFIAVGLDAFEPGVITMLRVGLGALALAVIPGGFTPITREDQSRVVALSVLWVALPFTLFPLAEQHINSAVTGLLNGAMPLFTALFALLFFGRRTTGPQLLGIGVGFAGIVAISLPSASEGSTQLWGVALVLLAIACYGMAINLAAPLQARYGSRPLMTRVLLLAFLWTIPYGLVGVPSSGFAWDSLAAVAVLGVVGTGLAFPIAGTLVGRVGPTRSSFVTYFIPVVALALGVAFQGDHVAALALLGVALVVAGAILASRSESPA